MHLLAPLSVFALTATATPLLPRQQTCTSGHKFCCNVDAPVNINGVSALQLTGLIEGVTGLLNCFHHTPENDCNGTVKDCCEGDVVQVQNEGSCTALSIGTTQSGNVGPVPDMKAVNGAINGAVNGTAWVKVRG